MQISLTTEKEILQIVALCFAVTAFFLLYFIARKLSGISLFLTWLVLMFLFGLSAELHLLAETATSWDFAFAVMFQSLPLMLGGTLGTIYNIYKRNTA